VQRRGRLREQLRELRTPEQAKMNTRVSQLPPLDERALEVLSRHNWLRGVWYGGK